MLRVLRELQSSGCKPIPPVPEGFDPLECYKGMPFVDCWDDIDMVEVYRYIRGNKYLEIPPEWKDHLLTG